MSPLSPIYAVFENIAGVGAAFTGKGTQCSNSQFSFQRPSTSNLSGSPHHFDQNLQSLAQAVGFDPAKVTMPNGGWPHSGEAIKAEDYIWVISPKSKTLVPVTATGNPVTYDAVATCSPEYVIGIQGADCPAVFLCDPVSQVIGLAHAGWKPIVRGVIHKVVRAMLELGATPQHIEAYISPGAGDSYNAFKWDGNMEPEVKQVFVEADRSDLLHDPTIRHVMDAKDLANLQAAVGHETDEKLTLKLSFLAAQELEHCGLASCNISRCLESCIVERNPFHERLFKYHSYRREKPNHGLGMSVLFLKSNE